MICSFFLGILENMRKKPSFMATVAPSCASLRIGRGQPYFSAVGSSSSWLALGPRKAPETRAEAVGPFPVWQWAWLLGGSEPGPTASGASVVAGFRSCLH